MSSVRFIVDGMLGSLARKLRVFGFDTLYLNDAEDERLIEMAKQQGRVLLTCDKMLFQRAINTDIASILLEGAGDVDDMISVLRSARIHSIELFPVKSRCPMCNGLLDVCDRNSVSMKVPARVMNAHERFYLCKDCKKVYWEGSHFKKLREFELNVKRGLKDESS
jgi:hypothetical protein